MTPLRVVGSYRVRVEVLDRQDWYRVTQVVDPHLIEGERIETTSGALVWVLSEGAMQRVVGALAAAPGLWRTLEVEAVG